MHLKTNKPKIDGSTELETPATSEAIPQPREALTVYSEQGQKRHQEDRYLAEPISLGGREAQVLAVMDGNHGSRVADLIKEKLTDVIGSSFEGTNGNIIETLQKTVGELDRLTRDMDEGSTLSLVIIPKDEPKAYVAVLGDSPVLISDIDGSISVSPNHNARTNPAELKAAMNRGAVGDNSGGGLYLTLDPKSGRGIQLSRALGDRIFDSFLDRKPDVYMVELGENSFVVLATDGVVQPVQVGVDWEVTYTEELKGLIKSIANGAGAQEIVKAAIENGRGDNVTAIVWHDTA